MTSSRKEKLRFVVMSGSMMFCAGAESISHATKGEQVHGIAWFVTFVIWSVPFVLAIDELVRKRNG